MRALRGGGLAALLVFGGCAATTTTTQPSTYPPASAQPAADPTSSDAAGRADDELATALRRATDAPRSVRLRVRVAGQLDGQPAHLSLLGEGIGIWRRDRQIAIPEAKERELLALLLDGGFASFERVYGAGQRRVRHSIEIEIDGRTKVAAQLVAGEQFPPLGRLVERLLAIGAELAVSGVEVPDLATGLGRVADGTLSTAVWGFVAQSLPGIQEPCSRERFWLRLDLRRFEAAPVGCDGALGARRFLELPNLELRQLAAQFAERPQAFAKSSVYAPEPFELAVEVLGHRRSIQARPQARSGAELASSLDELFQTFRGLAARVLSEGRPVDEP